MTRINTVEPSDLTNEWLLAEFRELPRIVNELEKYPNRFKPEDIPEKFTLNKGHVKFYRDKLLYLAKRHREIRKELKRRRIACNKRIKVELFYLSDTIKKQALNDWTPHSDDHNVLIERLQERFDLRKKSYTMTKDSYKQVINCEHSFNEYLNNHLAKYF